MAGKYTIRALLGFTGEVATYHAVSNDGREFVVKLFDPTIGQRADVMAALDNVRQRVARLPPGSVVPVFDAGFDAGTGAPFSASEYLRIPSLSRLIDTGPLSPDVVALIIRGIASVLDAAHALDLHHLALKPTNVFVGPAPDYAVRLTDFDASVIRRTSPASHEVYSRSAPWWAPEQLQPAAVLGPPADVFSTALIAFYSLTGRPYWLSCQTYPPDLPNWQLELMGQRVPVSQRARELGAVVNPLFDGVFARSLSVNQPERPRSAMELANVLSAASGADQARTLVFPEEYGGADFRPPPAFGPGTSDAGGYVATGGDPAPAQTSQDATLSPGLPPFPAPVARKASSAVLPIVIGVAAAVIIGGGGVAFLFMRTGNGDSRGTAESSPVSAPSERAAASTPPAAPPSPAPVAAPEPTPASPSASPSAEPSAELVAVTIRCEPKCDRIELDGKALDKVDDKLELKPGKYKLRLVKTGHLIREDVLEVAAGKPIEKEYRLIKINPIPSQPKNNCGQFLCP